MSRKRMKTRDKVTSKMTKDGLVSRNESTGEENRGSQREQALDLRGQREQRDAAPDVARGAGRESHSNNPPAADTRSQNRRQQQTVQDNKYEPAPDTAQTGQRADGQGQTYSQNENMFEQPKPAGDPRTFVENETPRETERGIPTDTGPPAKRQPSPRGTKFRTNKTPEGVNIQPEPSGIPSRLQFGETEKPTATPQRQKYKDKAARRFTTDAQSSVQPPSQDGHTPRLQFADAEPPAAAPTPNGKKKPGNRRQPQDAQSPKPPVHDTQLSDGGDSHAGTPDVAAAPAPPSADLPDSKLNNKPGRLQFNPDETAISVTGGGDTKPNRKLDTAQRKYVARSFGSVRRNHGAGYLSAIS